MVTLTTGPCLRLESLAPSGAISNGRCANFGGVDAQRLKDQHVLERVREMILAANDVGDPQIGVVGAGCHVISRHAARSQQREVLDIGGGFGLRAVDHIVEADFVARFARHAKAQYERFASGGAAVAFLFRHLAHAGIEQPRAVGVRFLFIARARPE